MSMNTKIILESLALLGGSKVIRKSFLKSNTIGQSELDAVRGVVESGVLSQYIGAWHEDFYGGPKVRAFEKQCADYFSVKHAITVNSLSSGLVASVGAIGIEPGDEVIVSPWTMSASATAILHWNAIPVFADIDPETFCIDPCSVEKNITPYTKAIIAIDIFGHSADIDSILDIAKKYGLKVISDTAQAPGAKYKGKYAGTLVDIGGFSLNYHKHIHTGEGGIMVTNDDAYAERLCLIRNHAEAVVGGKGCGNLSNMIGHNFRLGEIECAIGIEQLKKLDLIIETRVRLADRLSRGLEGLKGLQLPCVQENCTHVYYIYSMILDTKELGVSRDKIFKALVAEGVPGLIQGYQNIHLFPLYQQKIAYGLCVFRWSSDICKRQVDYNKGICPVAEAYHDSFFLGMVMCLYEFSFSDIDLIVNAFKKVWSHLKEL
jgi:perosamine synthetase